MEIYFGDVPGVKVGQCFKNRKELREALIKRYGSKSTNSKNIFMGIALKSANSELTFSGSY